ncbi:hypothetical protein P775_02835 [Puniceibacterium antarcticum]|uniref:Uncharacterized protein n=1 Tax=Puniceibacterium antarcticum TaxID=1206336 RepID=A0A2G8RJK3_9RHOB|nr:hypothetical protein P775_02835 [Puniceibacterium antarcticum]
MMFFALRWLFGRSRSGGSGVDLEAESGRGPRIVLFRRNNASGFAPKDRRLKLILKSARICGPYRRDISMAFQICDREPRQPCQIQC